jgi:Zn-dependent peptidase ImmA (M78 family)/transcriptional regulator with XRE-family HTH domain
MPAEERALEARRRRSTGAVVDFDPIRLSVARRLQRMQRSSLASQIGVSAAAITQYENGSARPTRATLAKLAIALGVPTDFFRLGRPLCEVPASEAHFRSLRATPAISRAQALAFAEISIAVVDLFEQYVEFPPTTDLLDPLDIHAPRSHVALRAAETRERLGLDTGPVPHVVRILESHGVVVLRLPDELDERVDAFSTEPANRPFVFLSPVKDDRARSRFDAAHELGHIVMHQGIDPGSKIVEQQAHQFATEFIAPSAQLLEELPRKVDWDMLLQAKTKWGISLAALAYRARESGIWTEHTYRRAAQQLSIWHCPEPGALGPPESPSLLGTAMALVEQTGVGLNELATASRIPADKLARIVMAGSETKPRIKVRATENSP